MTLQADLAVHDLSSQHGEKTTDVSDPLANCIGDGSGDARQAENSGPDQVNDAGIRVQQGADDDGVIDGPTVLASVHLAKAICESLYYSRTVAHLICQTARKRRIADLTAQLALPTFHALIRRFLYDQQHLDSDISSSDVPLTACPRFDGDIRVYRSAMATFHAPSDLSGIGGMRREHIRATPSWRNGAPRYDCAFLNSQPELDGMRGLQVVRILLFFSFCVQDNFYPCALVHWFSRLQDEPDEDTGMWMVEPESDADGEPVISVVHLDCIFRAAHLIPIFGTGFIPKNLNLHQSLDAFRAFYVNKFADHHAFEIAF
jgi:hypothetical protein